MCAWYTPTLGGLYCVSIYLNTSGPFPSTRANTLVTACRRIYDSGENPLDNIIVKKVNNPEEMLIVL